MFSVATGVAHSLRSLSFQIRGGEIFWPEAVPYRVTKRRKQRKRYKCRKVRRTMCLIECTASAIGREYREVSRVYRTRTYADESTAYGWPRPDECDQIGASIVRQPIEQKALPIFGRRIVLTEDVGNA